MSDPRREAFENWHRQRVTCCSNCKDNCPHLEWEWVAWRAATEAAGAKLREAQAQVERVRQLVKNWRTRPCSFTHYDGDDCPQSVLANELEAELAATPAQPDPRDEEVKTLKEALAEIADCVENDWLAAFSIAQTALGRTPTDKKSSEDSWTPRKENT